MRIAYIIPSLRSTGPVFLLRNLCDALAAYNDIEISVYYFDDIVQVPFSCHTYRISYDFPIHFNNFDIIHTHCFRADRYVYKWRNKINSSTIISTLHQDTYESFRIDSKYNALKSYLLTRYWLFIQSHNDAVVSISDMLNRKYRNYLKCPMITIYNGIQTNYSSLLQSLDNDVLKKIHDFRSRYSILLCTYALITKRKGISQVVNILQDMPNCGFVVIGDGPEKQNLMNMSLRLNLEKQILFLPSVNCPFLYIGECDIYIMSSYSEGFGLSMVEAAYHKKAIVCSDLPSFHEIFRDNAVFFTLNNAKSLKDAILFAYKNRSELSNKAYKRVVENFTQSILAKNHLMMYRQLLKRTRSV